MGGNAWTEMKAKINITAGWKTMGGWSLATIMGLSMPARVHGNVPAGEASEAAAWSDPTVVATGNGQRGPWRQNESEYDFVDDAAVAVNDHGFVAVAWADLPTHDIFLQVYDPEGEAMFAEAVNVSRSPRIFSWIPRLVISNGESLEEISVHVIWQDIVFRGGGHGGEIFTTSSSDGGLTFGRPVNLSDVIEGAGKGRTDPSRWHNGSYDLFRCPAGVLHAAWTEYEGRLWYSRSTDGGMTFSAKTHLTGGGGGDEPLPARAPSIAADGTGRVVIAHTVGDIADADIHLWFSTDGGVSFTDSHISGKSEGYADAPRVVFGVSGVLHLVYAESAGGPYGSPGLMYTRAEPGGMEFPPPRRLFEGETGDAAAARGFPVLRADAQERLHLVWERFAEFPGRPRGLGYSRSDDGGVSFVPPILVPGLGGDAAEGFNGSQQGLLAAKLSVSPNGRVAIANSLFVSGKRSEVRFVTGGKGQ